jgi:transcriptional regulator of heat shock response
VNKLKSLEIKRLLKELDFIESDYEYRNLVVHEADTQFINSISEFLSQHPELKKIYDDKVTEKINKTIEKIQKKSEELNESDQNQEEILQDDISQIEELQKDDEDKKNVSQIKRLYREIVKITHPDKAKSNKYKELYIKSSKYYESGNKIGIYTVCDELNIDYELEENDVDLIQNQISDLKNKINFLECTFAWQWYNCEDEMLRSQIVLNFIKLKIK